MKRFLPYLYSMIASIAVFSAFIGVSPTSWSYMYQPEIPEELK